MIWRRTSHGTDGVPGSGTVAGVRMVLATCCRRGRDVLVSLTECVGADIEDRPDPSLIK